MPDTDPGQPLAYYLTIPKCGVLFICAKCCEWTEAPVQEVIDRLVKRGQGDGSTGVRELRHLIDRACRCGANSWETRPGFPKH